MYQVMVVDDEPTAVNLIRTVIEKKCEQFEVTSTAYDGKEALEKLKNQRPDVLITDIQMPVMNGLDLVKEVKALYPEIICVVVSGYQEFEYVKQALRYGVSDYILKPIVPSEMMELFSKIEKRVKITYYKRRNILMHRMVNEIEPDEKEIRRYFQSNQYYGAIVRRNGLPCRFTESSQTEIFSDIDEWMLVYGRDEQETLYLCPEEILCGNYVDVIRRQMEKEQPDAAYVTTVICENAVPTERIGDMVRRLYKVLDCRVVLGKNQTIFLGDEEDSFSDQDCNYDFLKDLEYLAGGQKFDRLQKATEGLIRQWSAQERSQLWMESRVRQICYLLQRYGVCAEDYREYEYLMDEAFANAGSPEQLISSLSDVFFKDTKEEQMGMQRQSTEEYFERIKNYIQVNMAQSLSLQTVSKAMGVSQTYLSRLFRRFEDASFNSYLTSLRMEKAKELLGSEEKIFVKDVAEQVGYKDQFYFSRIFHTYTGVRPSEYVEKR